MSFNYKNVYKVDKITSFPISHVQNWGTAGYEINLGCIAGKEWERILKYIFSLISRQI